MNDSAAATAQAPAMHVCPDCSKNFTLRKTLTKHVKTVHAAKSWFCDKCDWATTRKDELGRHFKKTHGHATTAVPDSCHRPLPSAPASAAGTTPSATSATPSAAGLTPVGTASTASTAGSASQDPGQPFVPQAQGYSPYGAQPGQQHQYFQPPPMTANAPTMSVPAMGKRMHKDDDDHDGHTGSAPKRHQSAVSGAVSASRSAAATSLSDKDTIAALEEQLEEEKGEAKWYKTKYDSAVAAAKKAEQDHKQALREEQQRHRQEMDEMGEKLKEAREAAFLNNVDPSLR